MPPRNTEELQSFLGFANYYRDFILFHATQAGAISNSTGTKNTRRLLIQKNKHNLKPLLSDTTERVILVRYGCQGSSNSRIPHQEQEHNGKTIIRLISYGSKTLTQTQLNNDAPKLELFAVIYFIEKLHFYLAGREFTVRVDCQALSWLKTKSMDQVMIGRWISRLDQYHFTTVPTPQSTQKCGWTQQMDQRLRPL